jgi:hypothetical protein
MRAVSKTLADDKIGKKIPLRLFVNVRCDAFLAEGASWAEALKDPGEHGDCDGSMLDLAALDAGEPLSLLASPRAISDWSIQAIAPGLVSFSIGKGDGEDVQITGVRMVDTKAGTYVDMSAAHVSWNYSVGGHGMGASRVELAADCPASD